MTEDEAKAWIRSRVPCETMERLELLAGLVATASAQHNLVSSSTLGSMWSRHIVDSAQLLDLAPSSGRWIDLGAGAGFPGLVIAIIGGHDMVLAESRALRIAFLEQAIDSLSLRNKTSVLAGRLEVAAPSTFDIISARAYAPLDRLFESASHFASPQTIWVLPKGRSAQAELDAARGSWQGGFRLVPSVTDPDAAIIVADHVRASGGGRKAGSKR